jgi:hypothetical protein
MPEVQSVLKMLRPDHQLNASVLKVIERFGMLPKINVSKEAVHRKKYIRKITDFGQIFADYDRRGNMNGFKMYVYTNSNETSSSFYRVCVTNPLTWVPINKAIEISYFAERDIKSESIYPEGGKTSGFLIYPALFGRPDIRIYSGHAVTNEDYVHLPKVRNSESFAQYQSYVENIIKLINVSLAKKL